MAFLRQANSHEPQAHCHFGKPMQFDAFESLAKSGNEFRLIKAKLPNQARSG